MCYKKWWVNLTAGNGVQGCIFVVMLKWPLKYEEVSAVTSALAKQLSPPAVFAGCEELTQVISVPRQRHR